MDLYDQRFQDGPIAEQLVADAISAVTKEWKVYYPIPGLDRPVLGYEFKSICPDFYIISDGTCGIVESKCLLRKLTAAQIIVKFGALNFLQRLDAVIEFTIESNEQAVKDYQAAIEYSNNKRAKA